MILDEDEKITVGGKTYKLRFSVKSIFNVEKELDEGLLTILKKSSNDIVPQLNVIYTLLKWAIAGGGVALSDEELEAVFTGIMDEKKYPLVCKKLFTAIGKSGALGTPKKVAAAVMKRQKAKA